MVVVLYLLEIETVVPIVSFVSSVSFIFGGLVPNQNGSLPIHWQSDTILRQ